MAKTKLPDDALVAQYMQQLEHPLKAEIEALREIIKNTNPAISERIKWNAPSYYIKEDFLTFNHRKTDQVHLIFHYHLIPKINSPLLEGDYIDRRMVYFKDMEAINKNKAELERIINELISLMKK
ncbi:MAG: DUF1801 domain-containing protein [Saprospiraceae bacterium]